MDRQFALAVGAKDLARILLLYSVGFAVGGALFAAFCHFVPA